MRKTNNIKKEYVTNQDEAVVGPDGLLRISMVNQGISTKKKSSCPLSSVDISEINYKNLDLLKKFISERGKILTSRITGVSAKKQRALTQAIKRARNLALLSFIEKDDSTAG